MLNPYPNSRNVIPGEVFMTCEFRHPDNATLSAMDAALYEGVKAIANKIDLTYDMTQVFYYEPVAFDKGCVDAVRRAAERFGFSFEGIFRQHMIVKGRNRDTAWFAMLDSEWPARKAAYERWLAPDNFDSDGRQRIALSALMPKGG